MANRFENRFSLPPDEEPKPIPNSDGASASDNLPFKVTPEQAGKIVEERIPEAIPVEDTEHAPPQPKNPLTDFPEDQRKAVEDLADKQNEFFQNTAEQQREVVSNLGERQRQVIDELGRLRAEGINSVVEAMNNNTEGIARTLHKPFFDQRAQEIMWEYVHTGDLLQENPELREVVTTAFEGQYSNREEAEERVDKVIADLDRLSNDPKHFDTKVNGLSEKLFQNYFKEVAPMYTQAMVGANMELSPENGKPDSFRQKLDNYFENYRQKFESHPSFSEFKRLQDKQMSLLRDLSNPPSSAMNQKLNAEKQAVDEELNNLHNQIEADIGRGTKPKTEPEPTQPEQEKPFFGYRAPEVTKEGYEQVKDQFVGKLEEATTQMVDAGLTEDADYFRSLTKQMRKTKEPISRTSLWYFDKRFKKGSGRIFNAQGEDVLRFLTPKELAKHQKNYDLTDHIILPNYKPSTEVQRILLKSLGIKRPAVVEKGHFSTATRTVRGHYEQLGPADDPFLGYFHFLGTPDKGKK